MVRGERQRLLVALGIGLALHALLLLIPLGQRDTPRPDDASVTVELRWLPPPLPVPPRRPLTAPVLENLPAPSLVPSVPEAVAEAEPVTAPVVATPRRPPAATSAQLMAEPLLEDADDPARIFGPGRSEPVVSLAWQVPERQGLDELLATPLPELPFADPELVDFMYTPGILGDVHRGFDQITPEFGWTSNTGFKIRCRFVLVIIGCAWGR